MTTATKKTATKKATKKTVAADPLKKAGDAQQKASGVAAEKSASVQARIPKGTAATAKIALNPAKPHTPRVGHNQVAWDQMLADIGAKLTVGEMVQGANDRADEYTANQGRYVRYALRRGWVVTA